jgi:hypothetical protein
MFFLKEGRTVVVAIIRCRQRLNAGNRRHKLGHHLRHCIEFRTSFAIEVEMDIGKQGILAEFLQKAEDRLVIIAEEE